MKKILFLLLLCITCSSSFAQIKIILKLDDFIAKNGTCTGSTTLDYILTKKIKATIGAVATKFDATALSTLAPYLNATNLSNEKLLEVWHHGYDHIAPEFIGTSYAYQKAHFENANDSIKNCLRLQMRSFGAPFNHNDAVTNTVISENSNYKVCMFNNPAPLAGVLNLTNRVNMEIATGSPDYNFFLTNYNTYKTVYTDYMVLQGHPYLWGTAELSQFSQIVDYLITQGCVFVTPYEYYLSLNPSTPVPSTAQSITFGSLSSKLVGDADFSAGATASSGLTVLYNSSNTSVATIVNGNIRIVGAGTAIITASQAGDATYKSADYVSQTLTVSAIDYRSAGTGNWNTLSSWNSRNADGSWSVASSIPTAGNNVYIQNGHTITVDIANAYCNDLHLHTSGLLAIGANIVNVNGKIRAYTGTAVTGAAANDGTFYSGQTNSTTPGSTVTTATNGLLKFVGSSRNITKTGEWGGSGTTNFAEFALNADAVGVLATAIKFRTFTISSGTISAASTINVGSSSSPSNGNLIIKNGAKLISARVWTGTAGSQAITYNSTSKMNILQIDNGGTLELTGATSAIDCTTFTNNGTVVYSGSAQTLAVTSAATNVGIGSALIANYNNLTISGSGTKTLSTATTVGGLLSVDEGKLTTGANNLTLGGSAVLSAGTSLAITGGTTDFAGKSVTLKSSANESSTIETAFIENITGTLNNATNVTVQRYIPGGRRTSRFLGHPFSNTLTMASLIDNIYVTGGNYTTGFDSTGTQSPSSYWFDNATQIWKAFTSTSDASWTQYRGIRVLVRGDRNQPTALTGGNPTPNAVTLDITGTVNSGNQTISLPTGYSVLGNPYPSPVNLGARLSATPNIGTQFWYWDAQAGPSAGAYRTKLIGSSASLPMNGAFVVQPTAATSIAFIEADKIVTDTTNMFRATTQSGVVELQVLFNNYPTDNLFVRFNNTSNDAKDALDGEKLNNPEVNFYTLSTDKKKLSLDTRPFAESKIIPLGFTATTANSFKIKVADYGIAEEIYLKDKYLNITKQLLSGTEYSFSIDPSIPASVGENRFELTMKNTAALPTTFLNVSAVYKNAGIDVSWITANETNIDKYEVEESNDGINFTKATELKANNASTNNYNWFDATVVNGDNFYRIKAVEKNGAIKFSNVVKVKIGSKVSDFSVYPNPVKGGVVSLQFSNIEKGNYTVKVYNNIGQEVFAKNINHNGGSSSQSINIGTHIPAGKYNLQISNGTTVVTKTVVVE